MNSRSQALIKFVSHRDRPAGHALHGTPRDQSLPLGHPSPAQATANMPRHPQAQYALERRSFL